jgi:hypothetical protein
LYAVQASASNSAGATGWISVACKSRLDVLNFIWLLLARHPGDLETKNFKGKTACENQHDNKNQGATAYLFVHIFARVAQWTASMWRRK